MAALNQSEAARVALIRERFADYLKMIDSVLPLRDDQLASFSNDQITTLAAQAGVSADGLLRDESAPPPVADIPLPEKDRSNGKGDLEKILSVMKRQQDAIDKLSNDQKIFQSRLSPLVSAWEAEMGGPAAEGAAPGGPQDGAKPVAKGGNGLAQLMAFLATPTGDKIATKFLGGAGGGVAETVRAVQEARQIFNELSPIFGGHAPVAPGSAHPGAAMPPIPVDAAAAYQAGKAQGFNEGQTHGFDTGVRTAASLVKGKTARNFLETELPTASLVQNRREPPPRRPAPKNGPCRINLNDR